MSCECIKRNNECACEARKAHPHAALMAQFAQDAAETDKPWERWQYRAPHHREWCELPHSPRWSPDLEYRRKPENKILYVNVYHTPTGAGYAWPVAARPTATGFLGVGGMTVEVNFTTKTAKVVCVKE